MPILAPNDLQQLVTDDKIVGFTLDTTEFFHVGYNFAAKSLQALAQFQQTEISVILSEVVINEVCKHIRTDIETKAAKTAAGINQYLKASRSDRDRNAISEDLGLENDHGARATELMDAFLAQVSAETVRVETGTSVRALHDLYFEARPPFSAKADKKSEFPDAIALLSLERWAHDHDGIVLAVSDDGDWANFAAQSDHLVCVDQLATALNLFNRKDGVFAIRLAQHLRSGEAKSLRNGIENELDSLIEVFDIEAQAPYYYDAETDLSEIVGWSVADETFEVVASDEDSVTVAFPVAVEARFRASFTFSVRDGIDRDYVTIGGTRAERNEHFDVMIVATMDRDDSKDPDLLDLESESSGLTIDFGYVEIDYERD